MLDAKKNHFSSKTALRLSVLSMFIALLSGCGGGGGGSDNINASTNQAPTSAQLVEVSSADAASLQLSWLAAKDDKTPTNKITYQIHLSENPLFTPNTSTLKQTLTNQTATVLTGLKAGTTYYAQIVAIDEEGLTVRSQELSATTSAIPSAIKPNTIVKVLADNAAVTVTDTQIVYNDPTQVPQVGQYIASAKEGGFLRKVLSVTTQDGKAVATTENAALADVYDSYELNSSIKLVPVTVESTPATATTTAIAKTDNASEGTVSWVKTGLTLTAETSQQTTTKPVVSNQVQQAVSIVSQPIIEGTVVSASPQKQNFVGKFSQALDVPRAFSISKNTTGTIKIPVILHTDLKKGGLLSNDQHIRLCSMTTPDIDGKDKEGLISSSDMSLEQDSFGHFYKGEVTIKLNPTDKHLTSDNPYHVEFTVRADSENDGCNGDDFSGTWEDQLDIDFDVFVTDEPSFPKSEDKKLSFSKDFKVDSDINYTIEPKFVSEVRKDTSAPLSYARLEIQSAPKVVQEVTITATGAGTLNRQTKTLFERKFTKVYLLGSVPVVMSGVYGVDVNVEGEVTGALKVNEKLEFGYDELNYGVIYENGEYRTVQSKKPMYTLNVRGDADATARLKLSLTPRLAVSFYNALTGRLIVEPYVEGKAGIHGQVTAISSLENPNLVTDIDGWLTEASVYGGIDAFVAADFTVLGKQLKAYPEGFNKDDLSTYKKLPLLAPVEIIGLPKLKAERANLTDTLAAHSRAIKIYGKAENVANPFGGKPVLSFAAWSAPKLVAENTPYIVDGKVIADATEPNTFWFIYNKPGKYKVRLGAYSNMGTWARQVTDIDFDLSDADSDGMVDEWEEKYAKIALKTTMDLLPNADEDHDFLSNLEEYKQGTNPLVANTGGAGIDVSNANPIINTNVSFSLTGLTDAVKSVVWHFGASIVEVFENLANAISQMFNTVGDVLVSATLKDGTGAEITTVSTTVSVKPLVCQDGQVEQGGKCVTSSTGDLVTIFEDDFNDDQDDLSKWEFTGTWNTKPQGSSPTLETTTSHTEAQGYLELRMDQTDIGSTVRSALFAPQNHIRVEMRHYMQQGSSDYYFPGFGLAGVEKSFGLGVGWVKSSYNPDNWCVPYNSIGLTYGLEGTGGDTQWVDSWNTGKTFSGYCLNKSNTASSSDFYNRWITTVMDYNVLTGAVQVDLDNDGVIDITGQVPLDHRTPINRISIGTFGWWTGHLHRIDYVKVWGDNTSEQVQPTWTTNPANGHQYAAVDCGTWTQCEAQAVALGAHLVSVNDAAENDWLVSTFTPDKNYWIGLTDKDQEGVWKWTSGEAFGYSNWRSGQPDNWNGSSTESYVHMNYHTSDVHQSDGEWNDVVDYAGFATGIFEKLSSYAFYDTFDGSTLNTNDWVSIAGVGGIAVTGSEVTFGAGSSASTQGKKTFTGSKIVLQTRFAGKKTSGRDTHFELVDMQSGDTIRVSDTSYAGWGLNLQATGAFNLIGANNSRGTPTGGLNIETNGISTSAYKYVKVTIEGTSIVVERGDTADQITERFERSLGASIVGHTFYLRVGTGSNDGVYSPGTFDWISVDNQ